MEEGTWRGEGMGGTKNSADKLQWKQRVISNRFMQNGDSLSWPTSTSQPGPTGHSGSWPQSQWQKGLLEKKRQEQLSITNIQSNQLITVAADVRQCLSDAPRNLTCSYVMYFPTNTCILTPDMQHCLTHTLHASRSMHFQGHVNCSHWDRSARQPSLLPVFLEMKLCQRQ